MRHTILSRDTFVTGLLGLWGEGYDRLAIFLPGSEEHKAHGLDQDHSLVRAWKSRKGGLKHG